MTMVLEPTPYQVLQLGEYIHIWSIIEIAEGTTKASHINILCMASNQLYVMSKHTNQWTTLHQAAVNI